MAGLPIYSAFWGGIPSVPDTQRTASAYLDSLSGVAPVALMPSQVPLQDKIDSVVRGLLDKTVVDHQPHRQPLPEMIVPAQVPAPAPAPTAVVPAPPATHASPLAQSASAPTMVFGDGGYVVPNSGFTSSGIYIDPVGAHADNGGLHHADMSVLHQTQPASFGQALAFANILQGHKGLSGGVADMAKTSHDIDQFNAMQLQEKAVARAQDLIASGYSPTGATNLAVTEAALQNGYNRLALGETLPAYAKAADERAMREMDILAALGGDYTAKTGLGYTPAGIQQFIGTPDGNYNAIVGGQPVNSIPITALMTAVGSDKNSRASTVGKDLTKAEEKAYETEQKTAKDLFEAKLMALGYGKSGLSLEDRIKLDNAKTENALMRGLRLKQQDAQNKADEARLRAELSMGGGVTTGGYSY